MKLLVFAHTPPPHHGQSVMVKTLLDGLGGDRRGDPSIAGGAGEIPCCHVNARVSDDMQDVGGVRIGKVVRLLRYCGEALWCRLRHGADTLYYVPAPAVKSAIVRDWIVMLLVRPWFRKTIFHWHAFGLGHWACSELEYPVAGVEEFAVRPPELFGPRLENFARLMTRKLLRGADLSIVLTEYNCRDAAMFDPKRIVVVPNGIKDPCPEFTEAVLPERKRRFSERSAAAAGGYPVQLLFLAHCTREKGLFDVLEAVAVFRVRHPRLRLRIAGEFLSANERAQFDKRIARADLKDAVEYLGFVEGPAKRKLFLEADGLCFPTYFRNEAQPVVIVEALAFGLPVVTTRWRGIPEMLPEGHPVPSTPGDFAAIAEAMESNLLLEQFEALRSAFLKHFGVDTHLDAMKSAITDR